MADSTNNSGDSSDPASHTYTIPKHFDPEEIEDANNPYPRPLFLVPLPPLACQRNSNDNDGTTTTDDNVDVLAYGGDDGCIYLLGNNNDNDDKKSNSTPRVVRRYDDEVKSLAVSSDGLRVAVGFDIGTTKIYSYDDFAPASAESSGDGDSSNGNGGAHHPFIPAKALLAKTTTGDDNDSDEDESGFLSQNGNGMSQEDANANGIIEFDGPRLDASVRQLAFDPRSGTPTRKNKKNKKNKNKHKQPKRMPYHLAVASEDANKPLVIADVTTEESAGDNVYLGEKSGEEHEGNGVRSVAYSTSATGSNDSNVLLATLGMDGKLVTWDVTSATDPELMWDVCHKDYGVYANKDMGDMGGDAGDKACRPVWDVDASGANPKAVLFIPGKTDIQYKACPLSKKSDSGGKEALSTSEAEAHFKKPVSFISDTNGHNDTIISIATPPPCLANEYDEKVLVTGGRDGRLLLWKIDLDEGTGEVVREFPLERRQESVGVAPVTSLVWDTAAEIMVGFADGSVSMVAVAGMVVAETGQGGDEALEESEELKDLLETQPTAEERAPEKSEKASAEEESDDDGEEDEQASTPATKKKTRQEKLKAELHSLGNSLSKDASKFVDDEAEDGGDDDAEIQYDDVIPTLNKADDDAQVAEKEQPTAQEDADNNAEDAGNIEDFDFGGNNNNDPMEFSNDRNAYSNHGSNARYMDSPAQQPAFAPSSTPFAERRILCWNHVGVVSLRPENEGDDEPSENNLVDISFHETAGLVGGRRPVTFTDNLGFIVGTVGEEGGMFASDLAEDSDDEVSDGEGEEDFDLAGLGVMSKEARKAIRNSKKKKRQKGGGAKGSSVYFYRFETFGRVVDKDWVMALPDGERVLGCATGAGWGAVITSRRFLRLFTISGLQGPILWIPGEPVTICGRDRLVAVFYHHSSGPAADGTQSLGYTIFDGLTGATVANGEVGALSPGSELSWAGFSDKCALSVMDGDGILSMLARYPGSSGATSSGNAGNWMPMLDTVGLKKSSTDVFWPVEVHGGKLVCVPLRGGKEYPDVGRRPVTTTLGLRMPMATGLTMKSVPYEEQSVRAIFALNQEKVLDDYLVSQGDANEDEIEEEYNQKCNQVDKCTLRLFNSVVQAGKVERGFDLVRRLHSEKAMDLAIQCADRIGHRKLSDRIEELKEQRYPPLDDDQEGFDDDGASFDSRMSDERSSRSYDEEPVVTTRQQRMEMMSQRISPGGEGGAFTPRHQNKRPHVDAEASEGEYSTDPESPPRESLKRKFEADTHAPAATAANKRINPFAKKKMESPAKGIMKEFRSPTKLSLSRKSTFSAKSRQKQRIGKQIV